MNVHFHVMTGPATGYPMSNIRYESYEDSLVDFVALGHGLFDGLSSDPNAINLEHAINATACGEGLGAYIGTPGLVVIWARCEEEICTSANWN